jgi:isocitrate dehydrogenase (NAD+)
MHAVAIIRGDGIGPEISEATQRVLDASGARIDWVDVAAGQEALAKYGAELHPEQLELLRRVGVILKGPLVAHRCAGGVAVNGPGEPRRYPSINNGLRRELGAFANLRPIRGWKGVSGAYESLDVVIVRETTEDIYIGIEQQVDEGCAEAVKRITRAASQRVARFTCEYAERMGRRRITAIHKANVLHLTDGLFLNTVREEVAAHPALHFDDHMVDAACYHLVKQPSLFDVVVAPNQYGDIFSDLAGALAGSLGLAPGGNFGERTAMFEASHGAAPDIAGQGIANPISLILSGAMLLDHIGERTAAERVRRGVARVLEDSRILTADLGGTATTRQLTDAICAVLE